MLEILPLSVPRVLEVPNPSLLTAEWPSQAKPELQLHPAIASHDVQGK
jgi:hypothetical protein